MTTARAKLPQGMDKGSDAGLTGQADKNRMFADRQHAVVAIETVPLHIPFGGPFKISVGGIRPYLEVLLVRVRTASGLEGIGETQAWRRWGSVDTLPSLKEAIERHLAPRIIGRSPFELPAIVGAMDNALDRSFYAKAPLIDALYDLQGKILGVPVHALLGGQARDKISACAVLLMKNKLADTIDGAQKFWDRGIRTFTVKIGENAATDVVNVREIRKQFPEATIRVDANASMNFDSALGVLKKIEPYDLESAEQMVAPWDIDGMAELARRVSIPMMADESVVTDHDLVDLVKRRAATMIQTKISKNGGIWGCHKLWTIAAAAGVRICPGNHPTTSIGSAGVVHLAAAWHGDLVDGPFAMGISGNLEKDIVTEPLRFEGRLVPVPTGPGLGMTLDESVVTALRIDR